MKTHASKISALYKKIIHTLNNTQIKMWIIK